MKKLSGGERSRLLLARILKSGGNFLILDEPTNDLDLPTLRVLEEALIAFPGVVLVVSHDRYFLNRVCTDILAFEGDGKIHHSVGDYDYYLEKKKKADAAAARQSAAILATNKVSGARPRSRDAENSKAAQTFLQGTARTRRHRGADSRGGSRSRAHRRFVRRPGIFPQTRGAGEPAHVRTRRGEGKCAETLCALGRTGSHQIRQRSKIAGSVSDLKNRETNLRLRRIVQTNRAFADAR